MRAVIIVALSLLAGQTFAQEEDCVWIEQPDGEVVCEEVAEEAAPAVEEPSPLVGAVWCPMKSDRSEDGLTCDAGMGAALYRRGRAFLAAVVGSKTAGLGIGWLGHRGERVTVAAAIGLVAPYDGGGIYISEAAPALGVTFGF
jgi:hypothetical protein